MKLHILRLEVFVFRFEKQRSGISENKIRRKLHCYMVKLFVCKKTPTKFKPTPRSAESDRSLAGPNEDKLTERT